MRNHAAPPPPPRKRLIIVEDQVSIRQMLVEFLSREPDFEVVAEADNVRDAISLAIQHTPDVIILDWRLPDGDGAEVLRALHANRLHGYVLVLSGETSVETVRMALTEGARGFFEKAGDLKEFVAALRTVANGGAYLGPMASSMVHQLVGRPRTPPAETKEVAKGAPPAVFEPMSVQTS